MTKLEDKIAWLRAAVRDNKRLRSENRALLQTQDELVNQLHTQGFRERALRDELRNAQQAAQHRAGGADACKVGSLSGYNHQDALNRITALYDSWNDFSIKAKIAMSEIGKILEERNKS